MKHPALILVFALLLLPAVLSHKGHKPHPEANKKPLPASLPDSSPCQYISTNGKHYDLTLFNKQFIWLSLSVDSLGESAWFLPPCGSSGGDAIANSYCPADQTVCMVDDTTQKAVSFGSSASAQWSDGMDDFVEVIYGNGEPCNNGIPRKTVVDYICTLYSDETRITNVTMIDTCTAHINIQSKYLCSIEQYCMQINTHTECVSSMQEGLCKWEADACWRNDKNHVKMHSEVLGVVLIACSAVLLLCTCGLCICACKRRRRACRKNSVCKAPVRKVTGKKNVTKVKGKKDQEYTPFEVPFQLVPGSFAPNSYEESQGYPMTTFLAPGGQTEQQV